MFQRIRIRHPGYEGEGHLLFDFPAFDGTNRDHAHFATVWIACSILINNNQSHWLSTSKTGDPKVNADRNGFLPAGEYYLHVPRDELDANHPYAVVPNFRTWRFPHDNVPSLWREASYDSTPSSQNSDLTLSAITNESCRITNKTLEVDNAHIIPRLEKSWFTQNEMEKYALLESRSGETVADSLSNTIRLRCDGHRLWDKLRFTIVAREVDNNGVSWFTQAVAEGNELHQEWHCKKLQSLAGRPPEYLFARLAWNIFPRVYHFLQTGKKRRLITWGLDGTFTTREYTTEECRLFTEGQGQNRNVSPAKRARNKTSGQPNDCELLSSEDDEEIDLPNTGYQTFSGSADSAVSGFRKYRSDVFFTTETEERGRKRFRNGY